MGFVKKVNLKFPVTDSFNSPGEMRRYQNEWKGCRSKRIEILIMGDKEKNDGPDFSYTVADLSEDKE